VGQTESELSEIDLESSWRKRLQGDLDSEYMVELRNFLREQQALGKTIYPAADEIFAALNTTPFDAVKVVILGQDPYHGPGQAHGLCFSVRPDVPVPPSLRNIYKELAADVNFLPPKHGYLNEWAQQGVLLLNCVLTDSVVSQLNDETKNIVFVLWGNYAQKKGEMIDRQRHLVLKSPHPSPLSASRGFYGNHHFTKSNEYLRRHDKTAIDWQLSG
jgi:uracil-DNA glycosylase